MKPTCQDLPAWRPLTYRPAYQPVFCLQDTAVRMYEIMVKLQTVDTIFYEAQRQVGTAAGVGVGVLRLWLQTAPITCNLPRA